MPQNRERVYCVIIRKDMDNGEFKFPDPIPLTTALSDLLEDKVSDKYNVSDKIIDKLVAAAEPVKEGNA